MEGLRLLLYYKFTAELSLKEFWKSVEIWQSYRQKCSGTFSHPRIIGLLGVIEQRWQNMRSQCCKEVIQDWPRIPRNVYWYFWAYPFLLFSFSFFPLFSLVQCGRLSWLMSAFACTLKQLPVSYRIGGWTHTRLHLVRANRKNVLRCLL